MEMDLEEEPVSKKVPNKYVMAGLALVLAVALFVAMKISANMDRTDSFFADSAQLTDSALSWIPFERDLLLGATNISLATDLDTNQFVIHWKFLDEASAKAFQESTVKAGSPMREVACTESGPAECVEMKKTEGNVSRFEVGRSIWLLDFESLSMMGSTQVPAPEYLR